MNGPAPHHQMRGGAGRQGSFWRDKGLLTRVPAIDLPPELTE